MAKFVKARAYLMIFCNLLWVTASANPTGGVVSGGNATISTPNSTTLQVNQTTDKAIIDWQTFNIQHGETTRFVQPSASSISLNRVNPMNGGSSIFGNLQANGQVWLINPAGILFGPSAQVNVGGLLATTSNITNEDFLSGHYRFSPDPRFTSGSVINHGNITVQEGGLAGLVGNAVKNTGVIQAKMGTVLLGGAQAYTLDFDGDQLINFVIQKGPSGTAVDENNKRLDAAVTNTGVVSVRSGLVTTADARSIVERSINMAGLKEAKHISMRGGRIILEAGDGSVRVAGKLSASRGKIAIHGQKVIVSNAKISTSSGRSGGLISIIGDKNLTIDNAIITANSKYNKGGSINLLGQGSIAVTNTTIAANGNLGGGQILIGGNAHGGGPEIHANTTYIDSNTHVSADALSNGDGGKIVAWSDGDTQVYGHLSALGGVLGGNGGWIETSGHYLDVNGITISTAAPHGKTGEWLLDPTNIWIASSLTNAQSAGMTGVDVTANVSAPPTYAASGAVKDSLLLTATLQTALANNDIIVTTTNSSGTGVGNITLVNNLSWTSARTLTLNADVNILLSGNISATSGSLTLNSATLTGNGTINTGGNLTVNNSGNGTINGVISGSGGLIKTNTGSLSLANDSNTYTGATTINNGTLVILTFGNVGESGSLGAPTSSANATITIGSSSTPGKLIVSSSSSRESTNRGITIGTAGGTLQMGSNDVYSQFSGKITLNGAFTVNLVQANAFIWNSNTSSNTISGSGMIIKQGAGTLQLYQQNTYTGGTRIENGTILTETTSALGTGAVTLATASLNGAILDVDNYFGSSGNTDNNSTGLTIASLGDCTLASCTNGSISAIVKLNSSGSGGVTGPALPLTIGSDNTNTTYSGKIVDDARGVNNLVKVGTGTLTLTGSNTYGGTTWIKNGAIAVSSAFNNSSNGPLGNASSDILLGTLTTNGMLSYTGGTTSANRDITINGAGGGTLQTTSAGTTLTLTGSINSATAGTGGLTLQGPGTFKLNSAVGGTAALASVTVSSPLIINTTGITTTGSQSYTGIISGIGATGTIFTSNGGGAISLSNASNNFTTSNTAPIRFAISGGTNNATVTNLNALVLGVSNVTGALSVTSDGSITQTGVLTVAGASSFSAGSNAITLTSANVLTGAVSLNNSDANNVSLTNNRATLLGASTVGQNLTIASTGAITQNGVLTVGGTSSFTAGSNAITLTANNLLTGAVSLNNSGTNNVSLTNSITTLLGASTVGQNLTIASNGAITQSGVLTVAGTSSFSAGGNAITLTANNLLAGAVSLNNSGTNDVSLTNNRATLLAVSTLGQNLTIASNGAITQNGVLTVAGTSSFTAGSNVITLTSANAFTGAVSLTNSGANNVALTNSLALVLGTSSVGSGTLGITSGGSITQTGALTQAASAGVITIASSAATSDVTLSQANSLTGAVTFGGTLNNIRDVSLRNIAASALLPTNLGSLNNLRNLTLQFNNTGMAFSTLALHAGGNLVAIAGGAITQSGVLTVPGTSSFTTGGSAITLGQANALTGAITLNNTGTNDVSVKNSISTILDTSSVGRNLTILSSGTITQIGALNATGLLATTSVGGTTLNSTNTVGSFNATNTTSGNIALTNTAAALTITGISQPGVGGGNVTIANTGNLVFNGTVSAGAGQLTATSTGTITLTSGTITSSNAAQTAIQLAGTGFTNNVGAGVFGSSKFLVWSGNPASDNRGGLVYNFKQYNATYGSSTVLGAGNGFLYTISPTVTPSLTGTVTKIYDATNTATLASNNYSSSGAIDGDIVVLNNPTSGIYDTKNVGTSKNVSVSGISIANATNGAVTVYGYTLGSTSTAGNVGTITPFALAITATGVNKVYNATTAATVTLADNRFAGDVFTDSSTNATFADKNVGTGKTISVTGISIAGTDAGNYIYNTTAATTADITPYQLTVTATGVNKVYDASTAATVNLGSNPFSDSLTQNYTSANFADKNVANSKAVSVAGISISGADAGNYNLLNTTAATTGNITPATLTSTGITASNKLYDGSTVATLNFNTASLSGIYAGDSVALLPINYDANYVSPSIGKNIPVTITNLGLSGLAAGNYLLTQPAYVTGNILDPAPAPTPNNPANNVIAIANSGLFPVAVFGQLVGPNLVFYSNARPIDANGSAKLDINNQSTGKTLEVSSLNNNLFLSYGSAQSLDNQLSIRNSSDLGRISDDFGAGPSNLLFIKVAGAGGNKVSIDSGIDVAGYFSSFGSASLGDGVGLAMDYKFVNSPIFLADILNTDSVLIDQHLLFEAPVFKSNEMLSLPQPFGLIFSSAR